MEEKDFEVGDSIELHPILTKTRILYGNVKENFKGDKFIKIHSQYRTIKLEDALNTFKVINNGKQKKRV